MHEKTQYQQLQPEERLTIASLHLQGSSIRATDRPDPARVPRNYLYGPRRTCQKSCVLRSIKKSQLMAEVKRSPNRMAN